jgi:hypothetical protein
MIRKQLCVRVSSIIISLMTTAAWGSTGQSCRQLIAEDSQNKEIGVVHSWGQGLGFEAEIVIDADGYPLVVGVQPDGFNFQQYLITPVYFANSNCTGQAFVASQIEFQPPAGVAGKDEALYIGDQATINFYYVASSKNAEDDSCQPAAPALLAKAHLVSRLGRFVRPFHLSFRNCNVQDHSD